MFNLRPLAVLVASALYAGGIAAATDSGQDGSPDVDIRPINIAELNKKLPPLDPMTQQQSQRRNTPTGVNQQIRPSAAREKFHAEPERTGQDVYIVRLHDQPVATYDGSIAGYGATANSILRAEAGSEPGVSGLLNVSKNLIGLEATRDARVQRYTSYLHAKQQNVLMSARQLGVSASPRAQYTNAINGFSVKMTQAQAKALSTLPGVASVQRSENIPLLTDRGPEYIGAKDVWAGSTASGLPAKGEGMVVGIIDSGINSDHPSFQPTGDDGYTVQNPLGSGVYLGDCAAGKMTCNDKLIGAYSWPVITDAYASVRPHNAEDYNGHGSHVAGTVVGNIKHNVPLLGAVIDNGDGTPSGFTFDEVSGVAPHANIIAYQACEPVNGCPGEAILAAFDQAIADHVDVINFSVGGGERFPWTDAMELAFLSAREAGISVAVAAGNNGSGLYTLSHTSPCIMVVRRWASEVSSPSLGASRFSSSEA